MHRYRFFIQFVIALLLCMLPPIAGGEIWHVVHLNDSTLALTGDYSNELTRDALPQLERAKDLSGWKYDQFLETTPAKLILAHRPQLVRLLRDNPTINITSNQNTALRVEKSGFWLNPTGLFRADGNPGGEKITHNAEIAYFVFLQLDRALLPNEELAIALPDGSIAKYTHTLDAPSALYKYNQVGYAQNATHKYAYLGAWLGTAGAMPLKQYSGKPFNIHRADDASVVYTGTIRLRNNDPREDNGAPYTGEETLELDFSRFNTAGRFYFTIDGIGRSEEFAIGDDGVAESFYIHARGLYHKRCGIAKDSKYTNWPSASCHETVYRGNFPAHERHYGAGGRNRDYGFSDALGNSVSVKTFDLIDDCSPRNAPAVTVHGGWHDAADYDRRPLHLEIVGDLATVYLLRPQNFCDGQLNIPESGNGIPDILDEATWGLTHLLTAQQDDGGVGTWFETVRHPKPGDGTAAQDQNKYYIACATRASTIEYAGYAALLALALNKAGATTQAELFRTSAVRAWQFAMNPKNRVVKVYYYYGGTIFYRESADLPAEFVIKAACALAELCDDNRYLEPAIDAQDRALAVMKDESWRWSPFIWFELELFPKRTEALDRVALARQRQLLEQAEKMLDQEQNAYPYRIPWFAPESGWAHTMAWGTFHPLRRARFLIAAHAITKQREYIDAAYIAYDFHNGANPFGTTMTSGLGKRYPVRFLDLPSYADGIAEFVPGITPYRNTFGISRDDIKLAHGLFLKERDQMKFDGAALSLLPREGLSEEQCVEELSRTWPIWRRYANVEGYSVPASEYTVWETIAPAATVTGYLLNRAMPPKRAWNRIPATDIRSLPGYAPLP